VYFVYQNPAPRSPPEGDFGNSDVCISFLKFSLVFESPFFLLPSPLRRGAGGEVRLKELDETGWIWF
jgi:hypothetical protein